MTVRWTVRAADRAARRQLSAKLTEGEKMLGFQPYFRQNANFDPFSPSESPDGDPPPSSEGGKGAEYQHAPLLGELSRPKP